MLSGRGRTRPGLDRRTAFSRFAPCEQSEARSYRYGHGGTRGGDAFSGAFDNSYIVIACDENESVQIVETVRPILKRLGGICLVSDAMWVKH